VIDSTAKVSNNVEIHANVVIGKNCIIESGVKLFPNVTIYDGVKVGRHSVLHSGVSVRENCEIGERCVIQNNSTIGSHGFGYSRTEDKKWLKIPQVGRVIIEDDVEIGANSAIDCASVGESRIKRGTKIDNLVQIGHSCMVGEDALICAQTGLAGSSVVGDRVILAGQVGIAGHLKVGDDAVLTAKSATSHDVEPGKTLSGIPAFDNREWLRATAAFRRLGEMAKKLRELQQRISDIEKK
jgi:UDP-3-O-[3-hydroxymyristoyl] glucosamine N-acyltransferase